MLPAFVKTQLRFTILVFFILFSSETFSQAVDLSWIKTMGGTGADIANAAGLDAAGNIYVTGNFGGTADFDPGPAVYQLTALGTNDIYVAKYNSDGIFIWARQMLGSGFEVPYAIHVDAAGNFCITGMFMGTVDFDPGAGNFSLTPFGNSDAFIAKYDASGNFIWARQVGGTVADAGYSIVSDAAGDYYITGYFQGDADFDPGSGTYIMSGSVNVPRAFTLKLSASGNFIWAHQVNGPQGSMGYALTMQGNDLVITGNFTGTADFDTSPAVNTLVSASPGAADIYVLKLQSNGNYIWALKMGGPSLETPRTIATDAEGNIYSAGWYSNAADIPNDFDPGPGVFSLQSTGANTAMYLSKLSPSGNFIWAKTFAGPTPDFRGNSIASIAVDEDQNVYAVGSFVKTVDFDPGTGVYNLIAASDEWDSFIVSLNRQGDFVSAKQMKGPGLDISSAVLRNSQGVIYWIGCHNPGATVDACYGVSFGNAGQYDMFIAKFDRPIATITASSTAICSGTPLQFTAVVQNPGPNIQYQWQLNGINVGTNSNSFSASSLSNNDIIRLIVYRSASCSSILSDTSNTITMQVGEASTPSVVINTASTQVCTGQAVVFNAQSQNQGNNPHYQWTINGNPVGPNAAVFTTTSLQQGDMVQVLLTSNAACATIPTALSNQLLMQVSAGLNPQVSISTTTAAVCPKTPVHFIAQTHNTGTGLTYQWKLNGQPVGANIPTYQLLSPGNLDKVVCTITTNNGCSAQPVQVSSNEVVVQVHEVPAVVVNPVNAQVGPGQPVQITAQITGNYASYVWTPPGGLSDPNTLTPVATPNENTVYTLRVVTSENCITEASATIKITTELFIPNSFTPNNDGLNDIFRIPPGSDIVLDHFTIYDRYGNTIFHTRQVNMGWDGKYKGVDVPGGNYVYIITGKNNKGIINRKGNILLIR